MAYNIYVKPSAPENKFMNIYGESTGKSPRRLAQLLPGAEARAGRESCRFLLTSYSTQKA